MNHSGAQAVSRRVLLYEAVAFLVIIAFIWLDELVDLPRLVFDARATPVNWYEALLESVVVAVVGAVILYFTDRIFARMKYLEGIMPVCASCKKIRDRTLGSRSRSISVTVPTPISSHSICPECATRLYSDLDFNELHGQ